MIKILEKIESLTINWEIQKDVIFRKICEIPIKIKIWDPARVSYLSIILFYKHEH